MSESQLLEALGQQYDDALRISGGCQWHCPIASILFLEPSWIHMAQGKGSVRKWPNIAANMTVHLCAEDNAHCSIYRRAQVKLNKKLVVSCCVFMQTFVYSQVRIQQFFRVLARKEVAEVTPEHQNVQIK